MRTLLSVLKGYSDADSFVLCAGTCNRVLLLCGIINVTFTEVKVLSTSISSSDTPEHQLIIGPCLITAERHGDISEQLGARETVRRWSAGPGSLTYITCEQSSVLPLYTHYTYIIYTLYIHYI